MKKIIALILALSMLLALCGCGSNQSNREQQGYADQEEFLKAMAKGISNRLKNLDDEKERTPEEEAAYFVELVNYELKEVRKYDALTFEDELFNELAHTYINGCKTQLLSAQNYKNGNLYPSLWSAGSSARNAVIVELYSRYNLPITAEQAAHYSSGTGTVVVQSTSGSSGSSTYTTKELALDTVLYQDKKQGITITITGYEFSTYGVSFSVKGQIINNSNKKVVVRADDFTVYVNNWSVDVYGNVNLQAEPGKNSNDKIFETSFMKQRAEVNSLEDISSIEGTYLIMIGDEEIKVPFSITDFSDFQ